MPRKNVAGKALLKQIGELPKMRHIDRALSVIDLTPDMPILISGRSAFKSTLFGSVALGVLFICVPWRDVDPAEAERYREENAKGGWFSREMDHLQWQPSEGMTELKRWEVEKELEVLNAKIAEMKKGGEK